MKENKDLKDEIKEEIKDKDIKTEKEIKVEKKKNDEKLKTKSGDKEAYKAKYSKQNITLYSIIIISLILLVIAIVNLLLFNGDKYYLDLTGSKMYSLSKESKKIIKDVDEKIEIHISENLKYGPITDIAEKAAKLNKNIEVIYSQLEDIEEEYQENYQENYSVYVFNNENEDMAISLFDINRDAVLIDAETYRQYSLLEEKLVNSIISVTNAEKPDDASVAFLTGIEGIELAEETLSLYTELRILGITPTVLDLEKEDISEKIETIVIIGPQKDISKKAYDKLVEFQSNGGNFIIAATYEKEGDHPRLNKILASYGVEMPAGSILDYNDGNRYDFTQVDELPIRFNNILLPNVNKDVEITKDMYLEDTAPFFISPTILKIDSEEDLKKKDVEIITHVESSDKSIFKVSDVTDEDMIREDMPEGIETESFPLGVISNKKISEDKKSTAIIYSNYFFLTDLRIRGFIEEEFITMYDNARLASNTFFFLHPVKDKMIEVRKPLLVTLYKYEEGQASKDQIATYIIVIVFTISIVAIGVFYLYTRGHYAKYGLVYGKKNKEQNKNKNKDKDKDKISTENDKE